jgi:hypothetical protein
MLRAFGNCSKTLAALIVFWHAIGNCIYNGKLINNFLIQDGGLANFAKNLCSSPFNKDTTFSQIILMNNTFKSLGKGLWVEIMVFCTYYT